MTTTRIQGLTTGTPTGAKYLPMDSGSGTEKATIESVANLATTYATKLRSVSGSTDTLVASDLSGGVSYTRNGGVTVTVPNLSASVPSGYRSRIVLSTVAGTSLTSVLLSPAGGVTIDGSGGGLTLLTGLGSINLYTTNGTAYTTSAYDAQGALAVATGTTYVGGTKVITPSGDPGTEGVGDGSPGLALSEDPTTGLVFDSNADGDLGLMSNNLSMVRVSSASSAVYPTIDGDITLGTGTYRWGPVYSTVGEFRFMNWINIHVPNISACTVTGTTPLVIGTFYGFGGMKLGVRSRALVARTGSAGTATVQIREFGGSLVSGCTWANTGAMASVALASQQTLPNNNWYQVEIVGSGAGVTAQCWGLNIVGGT